MKNDRYRSRLIDEKIDNYLKAFGAICIEGPKWCGKTWTSEHHAEFDGKLYHYQDYKGREIDAVIELPDGNWCGFEIKPGAGEIDAGASNLLKISAEFDEDPKSKKPQALCVVCGMSNVAYRRPDGVYVVPITSLRN